jgi:hypothetical protein
MTLAEWIHSVVEGCISSATCVASRDPVEILDELEHEVIETTGHNLNGKET